MPLPTGAAFFVKGCPVSAGPSFGYSTSRPNDDVTPIQGLNFSGVGYVSTSEDADPAVFPLNEPVRFTSTDPAYLSKLGTGYLADGVRGLNAQLSGYGADLTVVRVAVGAGASDAAKLTATFANIIGDAGAKTGLWALRAARARTKSSLRLIGVPGYTAQQPDGASVANPVVAALAEHLAALKAIAVVDVAPGSKEAAIAARGTIGSERILPVGVGVRVYEPVNGIATLVTRPSAARVLGRFVATDNNNHGIPALPIANQPILGIADISRPIDFDLGNAASEGQILLAADVSIIVAGETGGGGLADGGFVFVGIESCATSDLWSQIHQVRMADYCDVQLGRVTRTHLGGAITPRRAEAWLTSLKFFLLGLVKDENILGFDLKFPKAINSVADVQAGTLSIQTRIEPLPVFRRAKNTVRRYPDAVEALVDAIVSAGGSASATIV